MSMRDGVKEIIKTLKILLRLEQEPEQEEIVEAWINPDENEGVTIIVDDSTPKAVEPVFVFDTTEDRIKSYPFINKMKIIFVMLQFFMCLSLTASALMSREIVELIFIVLYLPMMLVYLDFLMVMYIRHKTKWYMLDDIEK